ncbi:MAG: hypothetical protein ACOY5B_12585 [Spirochaetota bacterium]
MNRILTVWLIGTSLVFAQEKPDVSKNAESTQTEQDRKIEVLSQEVEKLKAGKELFPAAKETGRYGLGPAASKVYEVNQGVSIGGYGEFLYNKNARTNEAGNDSGQNDKIDSLRQIVYVGYKFNDKWVFNSEIEFEHAGAANVYTEFAAIDYLHDPRLNFRAGLLLIPMGIYNEMHEAPTFLAATRPLTETVIMPSTWRENGAGIFGQLGDFAYKLYGVTSLNAASDGSNDTNTPNFTSQGLRGGRQRGNEAIANEFSGVLRVDYTGFTGSIFGVSGYYGKSGSADLHVHETTILDAHADVRFRGIYFRSVVTFANLTGADRLRAVGNSMIGPADQMYGAYIELGYDVFRLLNITDQELYPHIRLEKIDTQYKVAAGNRFDARYEQKVLTIGLAYKPIRQIIAKIDYAITSNKAESGFNQLNFGLGYLF